MRLLGAVPDPNVPSAHPQHPRERHPRISPVPHQRPGPARLADRGFSQSYNISYRGLKLPRVSAALGRSELRHGADLPQVGRYF